MKMASTSTIFSLLLLLLFFLSILCNGVESHSIMPRPRFIEEGNETACIHPGQFEIKCKSPSSSFDACNSSPILQKAILRYRSRLLFLWEDEEVNSNENTSSTPPCGHSRSNNKIGKHLQIISLEIQVEKDEKETPLELNMDESYKLSIPSTFSSSSSSSHSSFIKASLKSSSIWGALRGLETFSQLVLHGETTSNNDEEGDDDDDYEDNNKSQNYYFVDNLPIHIEDSPAFPHRGLLIDTARHFLPLETILHTLDGMAMNKLNVLHWHATDAESMPIQSKRYPRLARKGAFSPKFVFNREDMEKVVEYAKNRGIRVIIEFDMPGHNYAWGIGYPELLVPTNCSVMQPLETEFWAGSFNPARESTYAFIENFLEEMAEIFPDQIIHLGGDEVVQNCWDESAEVHAFMKKQQMQSLEDVYAYFEQRVHKIVARNPNISKSVMSWEEVFLSAQKVLPSDAIVEIYTGTANINRAVQAGFRAVQSNGFYLNLGFEYSGQQVEWQNILATPLADPGLTPEQEKKILGAEACLWGEVVDEFNIDSRLWLRAGVFAERLWSMNNVSFSQSKNQDTPRNLGRSSHTTLSFSPLPSPTPSSSSSSSSPIPAETILETGNRLIVHRCRMLQRGFQAVPFDARDSFPRRSAWQQCEVILPKNNNNNNNNNNNRGLWKGLDD